MRKEMQRAQAQCSIQSSLNQNSPYQTNPATIIIIKVLDGRAWACGRQEGGDHLSSKLTLKKANLE